MPLAHVNGFSGLRNTALILSSALATFSAVVIIDNVECLMLNV